MELNQKIITYIEDHAQEEQELLMELAQIPAPSNKEERRAEFCRNWLQVHGAENVYIDEALNVVWPIGCQGENDIAVFMAHSDVVFPDEETLPLTVQDGKICCPGVGDDTANVAALLMAAGYIAREKLQPKDMGVLIVINSGEEGLGNLKGCRKIMEMYGHRVREFISFDGKDSHCVNKAVGSQRYQVQVTTEGGHSFADFGKANAIACLADLIQALYQIRIPDKGKTTYNVGTVSGGTSVNTIAQSARMLYEFRSDERESLAYMERQFLACVENFRNRGVDISVTLVGSRPCSGQVDADRMERLMHRASKANERWYGVPMRFDSGSTDCNIPLSQGIPAVCFGCYYGQGSHTREEFVWIDSLLPGMKLCFEMILHHF